MRIKNLVKAYYKPFLLIFVIYLLAFITMTRDQYLFADDIPRSANGYDYATDFNRFSANFIAHLVNMTSGLLFNIAPVGQIFAAALLAAAGLMLVYLFTGEKPSLKRPAPLILSTFLGLTPFMLNAWQYQFESPWFSAAIFAAILPYVLFWRKLPTFDLIFSNTGTPTRHLHIDSYLALFIKVFAITTLCNIFVWTSWQVATGLFLALGLALIFKSFIDREKLPWSSILTFLLSYIFATIFAYITTLGMTAYVSTSMFPLAEFIPGIFRNISYSFRVVIESLNHTWIILGALSLLGLLCCNKLRTFLLAVFYLILAFPVSLGPCLALEIYHVDARSLVGPVLSLTVFVLLLLPKPETAPVLKPSKLKKLTPLFLTPIFALLYSFTTCAWSYGNALTDQSRYEEFRVTMLINDLARLYPTEKLDSYVFSVQNNIGLSPLMAAHFHNFPVAEFTFFQFSSSLNRELFSYLRAQNYYGRNQSNFYYPVGVDSVAYDFDCGNPEKFSVVLENYYYTILDTRKSADPTINPLDLLYEDELAVVETMTEEDKELSGLNVKDFGVCVVMNPDAVTPMADSINFYPGQLVKDTFAPSDRL